MRPIVVLILTLALATAAIAMAELSSGDPARYVPVERWRSDGTGSMSVSVLCHHSLFSQDFAIRPSGWPDWEQNHSATLQPDGTWLIERSGTQWYTLRPDGTWDGRMPEGRYDVWLLDGNGGHSEYRYGVEIKRNYQTSVRFIGHAVSGRGEPDTPEPTPTVTPTPEPTATPTPEPTLTVVPTTSPTPEPTPDPCHWEWVCDGGWFQRLIGVQCHCQWVYVCPS